MVFLVFCTTFVGEKEKEKKEKKKVASAVADTEGTEKEYSSGTTLVVERAPMGW